MITIIISGDGNLSNYSRIEEILNHFNQGLNDKILIVTKEARGADFLGKEYANNYEYLGFQQIGIYMVRLLV